jgi:uncharacterized membrane protein (DUF106 family)
MKGVRRISQSDEEQNDIVSEFMTDLRNPLAWILIITVIAMIVMLLLGHSIGFNKGYVLCQWEHNITWVVR